MAKVRYTPNPDFERQMKAKLVEAVRGAVEDVFRDHAGAPEQRVRSALGDALRSRGIDPGAEMLDRFAPPISQGEKPQVV